LCYKEIKKYKKEKEEISKQRTNDIENKDRKDEKWNKKWKERSNRAISSQYYGSSGGFNMDIKFKDTTFLSIPRNALFICVSSNYIVCHV
jgi:hypothetical protein